MTKQDKASIWIVDDDESIRWVLAEALDQEGLRCRQFSSADEALQMFALEQPAVVVTDIRMQGQSGFDLLESIHQERPEIPVVIMTAYSDLDTTVKSFQSGAREHLAKPFDIDEAVGLINRVLKEADSQPQSEQSDNFQASQMIGQSAAMQDLFRAIGRLANSDLNVLVTGESGTGKELVARALYDNSIRRNRVFV